jgi:hypothetical protein
MGHGNTVHRYLRAMCQHNRFPLFCQLKRGRWSRGDFIFFGKGFWDWRRMTEEAHAGRESFLLLRRMCVCETFYSINEQCLETFVLYRSNHLLLHSLVRSKPVQMFDIKGENRRLGSPNSWIQRLRNLVHIPPFNWILVLAWGQSESKILFFYDPKLQFKPFPFLAKPYSQFLISSFIPSSFITTPAWRYPPSRRW